MLNGTRMKKIQILLYNRKQEKCIYKVFSIYKIENEDYYIKQNLKNDNEFEEFVKNLKKEVLKILMLTFQKMIIY